MLSFINRFILTKLWGWKIIGDYPTEIQKMILAVAPHTTMWEFPIGIMFRNIYKVDVRYFIKKELVKGLLGKIILWLGGIPVERGKSTNFVKSVADTIKSADQMIIAVTPEGTRKKVDKLKTGYYYIAKEAGIPILTIVINWRDKRLELTELLYPGEDAKADLAKIDSIFKGTIGKYPDKSYI